VIPEAVLNELTDSGAPAEVHAWAIRHPDWVEIRTAPPPDASLADLDAGEAAAIALAETEKEVLLLIDESAGRREASRRGIRNTGTLGVLRGGKGESGRSSIGSHALAGNEFQSFKSVDCRPHH